MKLSTDNFNDLLEAMHIIKEVKSNLLDEYIPKEEIDTLIKSLLECYLKVAK